MKKVYNYLFITLLLSIGAVSCVENLDEFSSDMQLPVAFPGPLGSSKITISDLLTKLSVDTAYLKDRPDGEYRLLYFRYEDVRQIEVQPLKFRFEKFVKTFEGEGDEGLLSLKNDFSMSFNEELDFGQLDDSDKQIDSVWVKEGALRITIDQNLLTDQRKIRIFLSFSDQIRSVDGGEKASMELSFGENILDLKDYLIDFTQGNLHFTYTFVLEDGVSVELGEQSKLTISVELDEKITYRKVWGYFKYPGVHEEIDIDLFKDLGLKNGELHLLFKDPKLYISATTNISVPTTFSIDSIRAKNNEKDTERYAIFKETGTPYFQVPLFKHAEDGKTEIAFDIAFNTSTVNLDEMLDIFPDAMDFKYVFEIGANGEGADDSFLWEGAYIDVNMGVELPAWFKQGTYISLTDTIWDVNLGEVMENDFSLNKAIIFFDLENGLPFDVDVDFSFLDENHELVVIKNPKLAANLKKLKVNAAAVAPTTYVVKNPTTLKLEIELDNTMLDEIKQFKHLVISYKVNVNDSNSSVKVTTNNFLQVKMSFYIKGGIKL